MRIKCIDCGKKFRTQGACEMHARDRHPHQIAARLAAQKKPSRKARTHAFLYGMLGGMTGVVMMVAAIAGFAVQTRAVEITPQGVVTLKPWITTVNHSRR